MPDRQKTSNQSTKWCSFLNERRVSADADPPLMSLAPLQAVMGYLPICGFEVDLYRPCRCQLAHLATQQPGGWALPSRVHTAQSVVLPSSASGEASSSDESGSTPARTGSSELSNSALRSPRLSLPLLRGDRAVLVLARVRLDVGMWGLLPYAKTISKD